MFDDSTDPHDHMLHYNQVMTLNAGNDPLLCKVFQASLQGPALAWFHKLPLLTGSEYVHKFITQLPKDYCLIPGKLHHKTC